MEGFANTDLLFVGIAVAGTVILGATAYFNDPKNGTNRTFFYFSLVTGIWGVCNYVSYKLPTFDLTLWCLRAVLFLAVWQAFYIFRLFYVFDEPSRTFPRWYRFGFIPIAVLVALEVLTPFTFSGISTFVATTGDIVPTPITGPGIALFGIFNVGTVLGAIVLLLRKMRSAEREQRITYGFLLAGTALMFALVIVFNFVLPSAFDNVLYIPYGALFILPFVASVSYAILERRLFSIKVAATALLVFALSVGTFAEILFSTSLELVVFRVSVFILVLISGITLIKSVLREVEQREEIERLSQEKSEFMSFASHEIRNPITAMRGYASLLSDGTVGEVSDKVKDVAYKILVNGDTVLSLISEFLNKSKLELGQISYNVADIDVGKTISSIGEGFKAHAAEKGLAFEIKIEFPGLMAKADEPKLREVVGNLIDNSVKYTKSGGVTVAVEKHNGMARVIVSDTGVGIPSETISHLFRKFSRADAQKMNLLGTGLGLYLAKTFVEGMGGAIWAESDGLGKGSRFIIELHTV